VRAQEVSGQKHFGRESLRLSAPGGSLSCWFGGSLFVSAEGAAGVVLRAVGIAAIRP